jgi:hypothetical protein
MRAHAVGLVSDDEVDIVDTGVDQCIKNVFKDWPSAGRQHRFRPVGGKGAESNSLTGGQHDR